MKHVFPIALILLSLFSLSSCSDEVEGQKARLQVSLTDDPADYDAVYIDLKEIKYNVTGEESGWKSIPNIKTGVYNLLELVNDADTLLADFEIPAGRLHQIRLILGEDNHIVVNGVEKPLSTPSALQSGLKLNIQQDLVGGVLYKLLLDFDAARSVVETGNETFNLKPVIRAAFEAQGGSITGAVKPAELHTSVYALRGTDTVASTYTDGTGGFWIKGLPANSYDLHFVPGSDSYNPAVRSSVTVSTGNITTVDTVQLQLK